MVLEELGDASYNLIYVQDTIYWVFLLIVVVFIDRDETQFLWVRRATQYFDGAYRVEHDSVNLSVLNVLQGAFVECDDVAMVNLWFHGVTSDIAPKVCFFKALYYDVVGRYGYL